MTKELTVKDVNLIVTSVWSSFGHLFIGDSSPVDDEDPAKGTYETCIKCGARFILEPTMGEFEEELIKDALREARESGSERTHIQCHGEYRTENGDDPHPCSDVHSLWHGEAPCQAVDGNGCAKAQDGEVCEHLAAANGCNCVFCT